MKLKTAALILLLCVSLIGCGSPTAVLPVPVQTVEEAVEEAAGQAVGANPEISSAFQKAFETAQNTAESLNAYGKGLYEMVSGGGSGSDFSEFEALFEKLDKINAAIDAYVLETNAGEIDPGDVQLLPGGSIYSDDYSELKEFRLLYYALQYNYEKDGRDQLRSTGSAKDLILFSFEEQEDGSMVITDARFAEKADDYSDVLAELAVEMDAPLDEVLDTYEFLQIDDVRELRDYLEEHPEFTGIEYDGEIRTAEDLDEIWYARIEGYENEG